MLVGHGRITNMAIRGSVQHKRGHNTIMTGLAMLVFGTALVLVFATGNPDSPALGVFVLIAFAGFITLMVGIGRRREKPVT